MAAGANWAEIWDPIWDGIWTQEAAAEAEVAGEYAGGLFTGAILSSGRVAVAVAGVVDHIVAGFAYTADDELVLDTSNDPQNVIKGIGIRNTGAVCATTTTTGTAVVNGVRISNAGKLVYADAASEAVTCGNPIRTTGVLAVAT